MGGAPRGPAELADVAATGARYDAVYALWPTPDDVPRCGWGCSLGPSDATFGAGFSSISTDHWRTLATDPDPAQGYVHEWLHQVEAVYRGLGVSETELPPLHDAGAFTSARSADEPPYGRSYAEYHDGGARTWSPWYRDWMTGRLRPAGTPGSATDGRTPIGLTPERWARQGGPHDVRPLISVAELAETIDDPTLRVVDCAGTWASPARDAAPTTPATCPERSSSTSTATWPTRPAAARVDIPCPPRRRSRPARGGRDR